MALVMKNGKKVKSYYNFKGSDKSTIKHKKTVLIGLKLGKPLVSWPKDMDTLLSIINTYLSYI